MEYRRHKHCTNSWNEYSMQMCTDNIYASTMKYIITNQDHGCKGISTHNLPGSESLNTHHLNQRHYKRREHRDRHIIGSDPSRSNRINLPQGAVCNECKTVRCHHKPAPSCGQKMADAQMNLYIHSSVTTTKLSVILCTFYNVIWCDIGSLVKYIKVLCILG